MMCTLEKGIGLLVRKDLKNKNGDAGHDGLDKCFVPFATKLESPYHVFAAWS